MGEKEQTLIFADGASKGNPGKGGWGALVSAGGRVVELGGAEAHTTNNRMELTAALRALEHAQTLPAQPIVLHTDSSYVIGGITKWVAGWQRRGWLTPKNEPVLHGALWGQLAAAVEVLKADNSKISWQHVGGHVGVAGNERVDEIASGYASGKHVPLFAGARAEYGHDIENISHDVEKAKERSVGKSRSGKKAHSYVSAVGGVVLVHQSWVESEARVKGTMARFKKATSPAEEAAIIKEFS